MGRIASALTETAYREVEQEGVVWRLRLLDPALAVEARALLVMVREVLPDTPALPEGVEPRPDVQRAPGLVEEAKAAEHLARILGACVVGARLADETEWEQIRIVRTLEEQDRDAKPPRVWYGTLSVDLRALLFAEAVAHIVEARGALRPFRRPAPDPLPPGQAGEEVRRASP